MAWVQVRPHFEMSVPLPPDTVAVRLRDAVARTPAIEGNVLSRHAQVTIPAEQRRLWSPWLAFEIEETPEGSHLSGVFLPHPNVWTLWFALMAMTGFTAFAAAMYGWSQWMAEQPAWAFWALLPCAAVAAALYGGALVGQQLGVEEMARLRAFVAEALDA
ncbi:MAG: hypothetical protein AMXMBFR64_62860 [Myxococcales bacterium]